ncbi:MAG: aminotransferase class V-fold PLP-dependent enzyme [Halioglobus sp.]|nr:aminotransferase class V-fold PLP-dependent enzyme [Halioglobus sp.]
MRRREFLNTAGLALGAAAVASSPVSGAAKEETPSKVAAADWTALRNMFPLTPDYIHLSTFLLASHPTPVAQEIEKHRRKLDENPADYLHEHNRTIDMQIAQSAAGYMGGEWTDIALTDSTTMGLAMVYSGLDVKPGDEMLQTVHDHYSTDMSLAHKAERCGAVVKKVALYDDPAEVSTAQCQQRLKAGITDKTRVVAVTWVHSSTGVKLPIKALSEVVHAANADRGESDQIIFCVDGVHGFGIEDQDVTQLGCDVFIAGTHKWIFGPRGTGVVWGNKKAWRRSVPVIPSFSASYAAWLGQMPMEMVPDGMHFTPGGFHSFEHRWALPAAFALHQQLGKANVQSRIHALNTQTKEGLAAMSHVRLYTPLATEHSSGLVCFDVAGMKPEEVVKRMHEKGIIMSSTPYHQSYARFAPSLLNNEAEIDVALAEIHGMA